MAAILASSSSMNKIPTMTSSLVTAAFDQLKRESLRKLRDLEDKSPKGSVDAPIVDMIQMINDHPNYVTSSSCSGRIAVFCGVSAGVPRVANAEKDAASANTNSSSSISDHLITKGGKWLLAEHATVAMEQLREALAATTNPNTQEVESNMVIFKHEPFIMHVVCRDIDAAKELLQVGISCGFRESGIVVGNKKIMCAIRTTANAMEIPLGRKANELLVSDEYLQWIVAIANDKFAANRKKTDQLWTAFQLRFLNQAPSDMTGTGTGTSDTGSTTAVGHKPSTISMRRCRALQGSEGIKLLQRVGHSSVQHHGVTYVFGGQGQSTSTGTSSRLGDLVSVSGDHTVHTVDTQGEDTPAPRMHHSAVLHGDQMVVFGGRAGPMKCFNDLHAFHFDSKQWTALPVGGDVCPAPRWKHSSSMVGTTMFVYGGRDSSTVFNDLFALDLSGDKPLTWRKIECDKAPSARFDHVGVALSHVNKLFVWGGLASLDETASADADACWLFDTVTHEWEQREIKHNAAAQGGGGGGGPAAGLFGAAACAVDGGAHVVVCGGTAASTSVETTKTATQKLFALSVATMEWRLLGAIDSTNNTADHRAALVYSTATWSRDTSELLVLGGGFQVFGFGQCYSSSFACELVVIHKEDTTQSSAASKAQATDGGDASGSASPEASAAIVSVGSTQQPLGVLAEKTQVKAVKTLLEAANVYDKTRRVHIVPDRQLGGGESSNGAAAFLLPVTALFPSACATNVDLQALQVVVDDDAFGNKFGKATGSNRNDMVRMTVESFAKRHSLPASIISSIPERYEFVSDVVLVPRGSFMEPEWDAPFARELWAAVCGTTTPRLSRVARKAFIDPGEKRQSHVELLYVDASAIQSSRPTTHGWVEVRENGITYGWDLTKVMFSSGNVTEKARMGAIGCQGDVIVDLFCGIGYYVVPFLVHGGAAFVHACEWNPDSVDALQFNLKRNHVSHKCQIYQGDNQLHAPTIGAVADRVNLGLLPTSEKAWPLAVQVMKPQGGWMHVHDNVAVEDRETWEQHVVASITALGAQYGKHWLVTCEHVEKVKSYAPKVHHLVADIKCTPVEVASE